VRFYFARLRARRAPGIPCALVISERKEFRIKLAQTCSGIAKLYLRMTLFEIDSVDSMG
jgi:hypothetical protein